MFPRIIIASLALSVALSPTVVWAEKLYEECLQRLVLSAQPDMSVGQLREQCESYKGGPTQSLTKERQRAQGALSTSAFSVLQHRDNYLLPIAINPDATGSVSGLRGDPREIDEEEIKFQISLKTLLIDNLFGSEAQLYAAYTSQSYWQAYNGSNSYPFRETNHEPELFVDLPMDWTFVNWQLNLLRLAFSHQSNGRSGTLSRGWDRVYTEWVLSRNSHEIRFKPWLIVSDNDNEDISDFMGHFQLSGAHELGKHFLQWHARHTLNSDNHGALQVDWSYPIAGRGNVRFYASYFDGYGESLIDYNRDVRRFGIGFKLGR